MNKPKFVKTRQFINENRTYLAFCAGSIATSTAIIYLNGGPGAVGLKVPKDQLELLKQGKAIVYTLKDQTLTLVNVPAAEAAAAL